jgi:hypothetical protein
MVKDFTSFKNIEHFKKFLTELNKFGFKLGEYAIFGSGPLAIRGLVKADDIDVIIKEKYWKWGDEDKVKIGNIEFLKSWYGEDINKVVDEAEIIKGKPYVKLDKVLKYKLFLNRKKDASHIKILKDILK